MAISSKHAEQLAALQQKRRADTLRKIQDAVEDIRATGGFITRKSHIDAAGVSSSTLSQEYVKEYLKKEKLLQFADRSTSVHRKPEKNLDKELLKEKDKNASLTQELKNAKTVIQELKLKLSAEKEKLKAKDDENALLRGQMQVLTEHIEAERGNITSIRNAGGKKWI